MPMRVVMTPLRCRTLIRDGQGMKYVCAAKRTAVAWLASVPRSQRSREDRAQPALAPFRGWSTRVGMAVVNLTGSTLYIIMVGRAWEAWWQVHPAGPRRCRAYISNGG